MKNHRTIFIETLIKQFYYIFVSLLVKTAVVISCVCIYNVYVKIYFSLYLNFIFMKSQQNIYFWEFRSYHIKTICNRYIYFIWYQNVLGNYHQLFSQQLQHDDAYIANFNIYRVLTILTYIYRNLLNKYCLNFNKIYVVKNVYEYWRKFFCLFCYVFFRKN